MAPEQRIRGESEVLPGQYGERAGAAIVGCGSRGVVLSHQAFLDREPVFTTSDLVAYLEGRGAVNPLAESRLLQEQWHREGLVVAVRPDVFAVVDDGGVSEGFQPRSWLVAMKLAPDSVLSHRTAVDYWGYAYTMWFEVVYSATHPAPDTAYGFETYRGVRFPDRLVASRQQHSGVVERDFAGGTVRVTTMERALVDIMDTPRLGGSWEEIWRTLARVDNFDLAAVAAYCDLMGAGTELRTRVGFFLDHHRHMWGLDDEDLVPFRSPLQSEPFHLAPRTPRACHYIRDWNLVVPTDVWERGWAAVH